MDNPDPVAEVVVSVLVPSFNSNPYITEAIRSALAQEGPTLEILVQDGGSTDGSIDALLALSDSRLLCISEPDAGQSDALNRALRRARGAYVIWLNADDLLAPGAVAALVHAAWEQDLDVVHGSYDIIDANGALIKSYSSAPLESERLLRHGAYIFSGSVLIRRTFLVEVGGFDANLHYAMDFDLLLRLAEAARATGRVSGTVAQFRRQPASKSEAWLRADSKWLPFLRERLVLMRRHGATPLVTVRTVGLYAVVKLLRPIWRSGAWLRLRPRKHLGGL